MLSWLRRRRAEPLIDWTRVLVATRNTGGRVRVDTSTRMALDADFAPDSKSNVSPAHKPRQSQQFQLQFLGVEPDRELVILTEVYVGALVASEVALKAARMEWPPQAIGFCVIDHKGREEYWRLVNRGRFVGR